MVVYPHGSISERRQSMTCSCPPDAQAVVGGVLVVGHKVECIHGGEPRQYVWLVEGSLCTGSLAKYATHLEYSYISDYGRPSDEIRTWEKSYTPVITGGDKFDDNDYAQATVTVENESAVFRIDGRI